MRAKGQKLGLPEDLFCPQDKILIMSIVAVRMDCTEVGRKEKKQDAGRINYKLVGCSRCQRNFEEKYIYCCSKIWSQELGEVCGWVQDGSSARSSKKKLEY